MSFYPVKIDDSYKKINDFSDIKNIYLHLKKYEDVVWNEKSIRGNKPSVSDAAKIYVLISYLKTMDKSNFDRKNAYRSFFSDQVDDIKEFIVESLNGVKGQLFKDIKIDIVKGSIYKIKKYFLENKKIKDIRGASEIIEYLNIDVTLRIIGESFIEECVIYAGGGNVYIVLPEGKGREACKRLEEEYTSIALTAMNAFECETTDLNTFFNDYKRISGELNKKLEGRKKVKIYPINPDNQTDELNINGNRISLRAAALKEKGVVCELCAIRDAKFLIDSPDGQVSVCPSCLRKNRVGKDKSNFANEFKSFTGKEIKSVKTLEDLKDDRDYVAVIYGDGNNMGNYVMNINNPFEMMYFSRTLDYITKKAVYESFAEVMRDDIRFEIIALGGDDIFVIVPAVYALEVSRKIIEKFDGSFKNNITMSVGVCIAKYNTPIGNMFDIAQTLLKNAKKKAKNLKSPSGTVDVKALEGNSFIDFDYVKERLFPATVNELASYYEAIKKMKEKNVQKSQLYKLRYAAETMAKEEFELFYLYQNARTIKELNKIVAEMFRGKTFTGYVNGIYSPWADICMLWDYVRW